MKRYEELTAEEYCEIMRKEFAVYEHHKPETKEQWIKRMKAFWEKYGNLPLSERPLFIDDDDDDNTEKYDQ